MTEWEILFLLVVGIYLSDCLCWVAPYSIIFWSFSWKNPKILHAEKLPGNRHGAVALANPLPPLGTLFVVPPSKDIEPDLNSQVPKIEKLIQLFQTETGDLRFFCNALWIHFFVLFPLGFRFLGFTRILIPWGMIFLFLITGIIWLFWLAHRNLHPTQRKNPFGDAGKMLLCFPVAMRALDLLSKDLLAEFHPLAIAFVTCDKERFRTFAGQICRELRHPLLKQTDDEKKLLVTVEKFLTERKVSMKDLLQPPARLESSCTSYCPRCLAQYVEALTNCPDCPGVNLVTFASQDKNAC